MKFLTGKASEIIASILAIFAPAKALIFSCGFLILADLVTGIWAAIKRGDKLNSAAMRRTVSKIVIYQIAILSAFLIEQYMLENFIPVSKIVASVIGLVELKSILENCNTIMGYNLFKSVISRLGSENDKINKDNEKPRQ